MTVSSSAELPKHPRRYWFCYCGVLLVAALFRFLPIGSGLPYSDYVDEGHVLHQTIDAFKHRSLDADWYGLPAFPAYATGVALLAYGPLYNHFHGHSFGSDLPIDHSLPSSKSNYDLITPSELIVVGRCITASLSFLSVLLIGIIAGRLDGNRTALLAMLFAAICPALVTRGSIVIVDTFATFFALVTLYFCLRIQTRATQSVWRDVALAGLGVGLTFSSKYPVAAVGVAVLMTILVLPEPWSRRVRLMALAAATGVVGILGAAPMTFFKPVKVLGDIAENVRAYGEIHSTQGYIAQAISTSELGVPLLLAGLAGIILMLRCARTRWVAIAWLLFAAVLITLFSNSSFRPFRSFLSLVPLLCIAAAIAFSNLFEWSMTRNHRWFRFGVTLALLCSCVGSLGLSSVQQVRGRMEHQDTRIQAINWLREHVRHGETVLAIRELAILPAEWKRINSTPTVVSLFEAADALQRQQFDYIATGEFDLRHASDPAGWSTNIDRWKTLVQPMPVKAEFGQVPTPVVTFVWRTNHERILILKRKPDQ